MRDQLSRSAMPRVAGKFRRIAARLAAAIFGVAVLATVALPASAATSRTVAPASSTVATVPSAVPNIWYLYSYYPTQQACRAAGIYKMIGGSVGSFKCVEVTQGAYFLWALWLFS
jgi:hypothetical protein